MATTQKNKIKSLTHLISNSRLVKDLNLKNKHNRRKLRMNIFIMLGDLEQFICASFCMNSILFYLQWLYYFYFHTWQSQSSLITFIFSLLHLHVHSYGRFLNRRHLLKIVRMLMMIIHLLHVYKVPDPVLSALLLLVNLISAVLQMLLLQFPLWT